MFVHCCHCTWCQRETGSAFAVNALIETAFVEVVTGEAEVTILSSNSGKGQRIVRCSGCKVALWSHYGAAEERVAFVRVGTLEEPGLCSPDIHIFTATRQQWVQLDDSAPAVAEYYRRSEYWPRSSIERYRNAVQA